MLTDMKADYGNPNKSTLQIIDEHIRQLEYNFMVVGVSRALLTELGTAYKTKMQLLNLMQNGHTNHFKVSKTNYHSKLNSQTDS